MIKETFHSRAQDLSTLEDKASTPLDGTGESSSKNIVKVLYVIVREDLETPIIQSQVMDIIELINRRGKVEISVLWFYRFDYLLRGTNSIYSVRKSLTERNIELFLSPFISWKFPISSLWAPFVYPQLLLGLHKYILKTGFDILHCRSYHAGLVGNLYKKLSTTPQILFDPRSPFIEENLQIGTFAINSREHRHWLTIEKRVTNESDAIVAVSPPFSQEMQNNLEIPHPIYTIPNSYSNRSIPPRPESSQKSDLLICYAGSLGNWNSAKQYLDFLSMLIGKTSISMRARFFIQEQYIELLNRELSNASKSLAEMVSFESATEVDILQRLSLGTVGIQILSYPDTRLAIKFVEYLAAGLPVIVSENVLGAAYYVRKYNVGAILKADKSNVEEVIDFMLGVYRDRESWRRKCIDLADRLFSPDVVARSLECAYLEMYNSSRASSKKVNGV